MVPYLLDGIDYTTIIVEIFVFINYKLSTCIIYLVLLSVIICNLLSVCELFYLWSAKIIFITKLFMMKEHVCLTDFNNYFLPIYKSLKFYTFGPFQRSKTVRSISSGRLRSF